MTRYSGPTSRLIMRNIIFVVLFLCILNVQGSETAFVNLKAKMLAQTRVKGPGFSMRANSIQHCLALCNKRPDQCDSVNFYVPTGKCRILQRCAPISFVFNSENYYFYSKRPQIVSDGFVFETKSGSCLKVIRNQTDFATADKLCAEQKGRLATLNTPTLNQFAAALLRAAKAQYAWFGLRDVGVEGDPTHSDGSRVSEKRFFQPAPQHWRNATNKNCWAVQDDGKWAELSCKGRSLFSVCEVPPF